MNKEERVKIIIIDSGVESSHEKITQPPKGFCFQEGKVYEDFCDKIGHGTAIYGIISKNCEADILNVKLMEREGEVNEEDLIGVLHHIYENFEADVINISLGVNVLSEVKPLEKICRKLEQRGTVIVSAFDNNGAYSYPAVLKEVIGVTSSDKISRTDEFEYVLDEKVNIVAKGTLQKVLWKDSSMIMTSGNSFACAYVSAKVANYKKQGCRNKTEVLEAFQRDAKKIYETESEKNIVMPEFKIYKAALFPFSKEMHSIIRFLDLCDFEVVDVYDAKYTGHMGSNTRHLMKDENTAYYEIKNIEEIDWNTIDTLILGHLEVLSEKMKKSDLRKQIVASAMEHQVNIYAFDDLSEIGMKRSEHVFWPEITAENVGANPFGKLFRIGKPVLGVFGTSSKQGKYTLQLQLRKQLLKKGFKVGQIGTEPTAYLFGMDCTYPMGYGNTVHIEGISSVCFLNKEMNRIADGKDIVIVGSQSGSVPYDYGNICLYNMYQYYFLLGTLPDAMILCINPFDEPEYVERTIDFLASAAESEVIGIVVFPMDLKNPDLGIYGGYKPLEDEKYAEIKERFDLPVFKLGDTLDLENLIHCITEFFS